MVVFATFFQVIGNGKHKFFVVGQCHAEKAIWTNGIVIGHKSSGSHHRKAHNRVELGTDTPCVAVNVENLTLFASKFKAIHVARLFDHTIESQSARCQCRGCWGVVGFFLDGIDKIDHTERQS